ncbi:MAG: alcohol dehydrogenase catalytic domain-containing protein [Streptosporangiaceae bacterium]|nr:alcohol dehydrogenase catalytic domain-containing protein [Streptosporangiaceae bacterium]MBV9856661.1 alcohol dehydrogenase catalytic domain-containing protein [Streptosporangiaceae bacterium]
MRAAVVEGPGRVAVRTVPVPPRDGRALVRVDQAGICGTDLKIAAGSVPVAASRVMGHEMTGRVEVAAGNGRVPAGTRVLVNPGVFCGRCDLCGRGLPNICRNGGLLGRDLDGCFAELIAVPGELLHPIPDSLPADDAALLQVLATCVHAQVSPEPLRTAAVVGLGVTGLLHVQLLAVRGIETIVGITRSAWKRDLAARFGAGVVAAPDDAAEAVARASGGRGADLVIECAGTAETLAQSMRLAGPGGTVVVFGTTAPAADGLPTYQWYYNELTIRCPRAQRPGDCDEAIALAASGRVELAPLVTARFPLAAAAGALRACEDPTQLKVVLDIPAVQ